MIQVFPSKSELAQTVAENVVASISKAIETYGSCALAVAGGSTPRDVYARLATPALRDQVQWEKVHLFWGDERTVAPDHPESNYGMVKHALLDHISIPEQNIHRICGEMEPAAAAAQYQEVVRKLVKGRPAVFDLILLGLGADGHTASLFPETEVLNEVEREVAAVFVPKLSTWRITLTLPVLNNAREVVFLVAGSAKAKIIKEIMADPRVQERFPATQVRPQNGTICWMLDAEAAALITT